MSAFHVKHHLESSSFERSSGSLELRPASRGDYSTAPEPAARMSTTRRVSRETVPNDGSRMHSRRIADCLASAITFGQQVAHHWDRRRAACTRCLVTRPACPCSCRARFRCGPAARLHGTRDFAAQFVDGFAQSTVSIQFGRGVRHSLLIAVERLEDGDECDSSALTVNLIMRGGHSPARWTTPARQICTAVP